MFKKSLVYLSLNYIIQFINIVLTLLFIRYLSSYQMGSLTLARTWQQLVDYAHLGTRFSLDRYIPMAESEERIKMVASVLFFTIISASIILIAAVFSTDGDVTVTALTICGVGISIVNIIKSYYRASDKINQMLLLVVYCQLFPIIIPLFIYLISHDWNYYLLSSVLSYTLSVAHLFYKERCFFSAVNIQAVYSIAKKIALSSLWLFGNSIFIFLYLTMDRFFIDYIFGRSVLGDYSIITFAFSALMIIPATCAELLFVKVVKQSCQSGKVLFLRELLIMISITGFGIICANALMGYFIINFTNYADLIPQMHLATLAVIPFSFTAIYFHVMNGLDLRKEMLCVSVIVTIGLCIYYAFPVYDKTNYDLNYYLYAKLATGWLILLGYMFFIFLYKYKKITTAKLN